MGARQRRGVVRVVNDRKRQGAVSPGMAPPIQGLGRLLVQQPVVEATGVELADAALQFAQMALLDLGEPLPFLGCWPDADSLLIEQIHFAIQMLHQVEQGIALLDFLRVELPCEVTHPPALNDRLIVSS